MPYALEARVRVRSINRDGVVREIVRPGLYRVQVGGMLVTCREEEIFVPEEPKPAKRRAAPPAPAPRARNSGNRSPRPSPKLDLHGLRVHEALPLVTDRISAAVMHGLDRVEIVHGIGTGKLRDAIHEHLRSLSVVESFKCEQANPGVTVVFL